MDGFRIDTSAPGFAERMAAAPRIFAEEISAEIDRVGLTIEADAKRGSPVDRGTLRRSITTTPARPITGGDGTRFLGSVGTNLAYAQAVHEGRRPGSFPPVAPLVAWARRKGSADPEAAGFLIARAIARRGIKGRPFLRDAFERHAPEVPGRMTEATRRALARVLGG